MKSNKTQNGKVCICVKPIHILFIIFIVVSIAIIFLIPNGTRFQGALIQPQEQEERREVGTLVVEYIKESEESMVDSDSKNVILGNLGFKTDNEPVEITAITFELEGDTNNESFEELSLQGYEDVEFVWLGASTLLVDISANPLEINEYSEVALLAGSLNVDAGTSSSFHFIDAVAKGLETGETVTSLGVNGMLDPVPQKNKYL